MLFSFEETPGSRQESLSDSPSFIYQYKAVGEQDDLAVKQHAIGATPTFVVRPAGFLYRNEITIDPDGYAQYLVTVKYGKQDKSVGSYTFTFDTSGATVNIKAGKELIAAFPALESGETAHGPTIGVKADGEVEGAEIVIPALKLSVSFKHPQGIITLDYVKNLARHTGKTNANPFLGFDAGELLFIGASGSDGSQAEADCSYQFAASENASSMSIGDITGIVKAGHHIAWIEFEDGVSDGKAVKQPARVFVVRVYDSIDFASLFGWS